MDPRIHAYRPDLAAERLRGQVDAPRFAKGSPAYVRVPTVTVNGEPSSTARATSQLLLGETVTIYDQADGWAWVQAEADNYVGYVPSSALSPGRLMATHRIGRSRTLAFAEPDYQSPVVAELSLLSQVRVEGESGRYVELAGVGWTAAEHLWPVDELAADPVAVALSLVGTPYRWGGRSGFGIDCSGLVQVALAACGISAPRDSDQQSKVVGEPVPTDSPWQRGDLLFWPGHVGIVLDPAVPSVLHASSVPLAVVIEPYPEVQSRNHPLTGVRRLPTMASAS